MDFWYVCVCPTRRSNDVRRTTVFDGESVFEFVQTTSSVINTKAGISLRLHHTQFVCRTLESNLNREEVIPHSRQRSNSNEIHL